MFVLFPPRIDKVKDAIVGPNSRVDLFVYPDSLRLTLARFGILSCLMKFAILRQGARRVTLWLIDYLGVRAIGSVWFVVAFVDQNCTAFLNSVAIRGIPTERHQNHRMVPAKTEVHTLLKRSEEHTS